MKTTGNYGLKKPEGTDVVNIDDLNYNADVIDSELAKKALRTDIPSVPTKTSQLQNDSKFITSSSIPESLPANGGNATTVNNHTAKSTPSTTEKIDLIAMVNEVNNNLSETMPKKGGQFTGIVQAQNNTSYTIKQIRNSILSPNDADVNLMSDGDIWIKYK